MDQSVDGIVVSVPHSETLLALADLTLGRPGGGGGVAGK